MDLFQTLKNLKVIEPGGNYTKRSRGLILNKNGVSIASLWSVAIRNIQIGASLALAGILVFAFLGGLAAWNIFSPVNVTALDPASLRAEAEAIDIQIKLADLNYQESIQTKTGGESTNAIGGGALNLENVTTTPSGIDSGTTDNEQPLLSVDEALQILSE